MSAILANVSSRLRTACAHMAPADFHALVLDIARMKLRWSGEHPAVAPSMAPVGESRGGASRQGARDGGQRS